MVSLLMVILEIPFAETEFFLVTAEMVILIMFFGGHPPISLIFRVHGLGDIAGDGQLQIS